MGIIRGARFTGRLLLAYLGCLINLYVQGLEYAPTGTQAVRGHIYASALFVCAELNISILPEAQAEKGHVCANARVWSFSLLLARLPRFTWLMLLLF